MMNIFKAWNPEFLERLSRHRSLKAIDRRFLADMARLAAGVPNPHAAMTHRQLNHLKDLLEMMPPEILQSQPPAAIRRDSGNPAPTVPVNALGILWPQTKHSGCKKWHGDIKGIQALLCATEGPESERFPFEIFAVGKDSEPEFQSALTAAANETGEAFYRGVFAGMRLVFRRKPRAEGGDIFEVLAARQRCARQEAARPLRAVKFPFKTRGNLIDSKLHH
jgi:hypothetical protein